MKSDILMKTVEDNLGELETGNLSQVRLGKLTEAKLVMFESAFGYF